jgi:glutathione S-transferase
LELKYLGLEFEDVHYVQGPAPDFDGSAWFSVKETLGFDFPDLPYLIDGDVKVTQSVGIMKYIARKAGKLLPRTDAEMTATDLAEGVVVDLRRAFTQLCYNPKFEEMKDNYLKKVVTPLTRCTNFLAGKKWLAGNTLTHVDFMFYEFLDQLRVFEASLFDGFPALKEYMTQFEALPGIQEYLASDQCMKRPINNTIAQWK